MKKIGLGFFLLTLIAACSSSTESGGGSETEGSGGSTSSTSAASTTATTSTGQGGASCGVDETRAATVAYCEASAALWADVSCPHAGCEDGPIDAATNAAVTAGCACELIAHYECEKARFEAEDPTTCACGSPNVTCPDDTLCDSLKTAFETCYAGG